MLTLTANELAMGIVSLGSRRPGYPVSNVLHQPMRDAKNVSMSALRMGVPLRYNLSPQQAAFGQQQPLALATCISN